MVSVNKNILLKRRDRFIFVCRYLRRLSQYHTRADIKHYVKEIWARLLACRNQTGSGRADGHTGENKDQRVLTNTVQSVAMEHVTWGAVT